MKRTNSVFAPPNPLEIICIFTTNKKILQVLPPAPVSWGKMVKDEFTIRVALMMRLRRSWPDYVPGAFRKTCEDQIGFFLDKWKMWVVWGGREGGQGDQADWGDQCNDNQKEQEGRGARPIYHLS